MTTAKTGKVLIVDDNEDLLKAAKLFLKRHFLQVDTEANPNALPNLLNNEQYDVILLDMNFTKDVSSGSEGFFWLDRILQIDPSAVVVLITAYGDINLAVRAIKEGAADFVVKPWENEKLLATLWSAMNLRASREEASQLRSQQKLISADLDQRFSDIIGQSHVMQRVFETIEHVAKTDANVLILGENGTGKEVIARAIHRRSLRASNVFISVDLGAVTETLFESEMFGHVRGAFTDAKEDRAGRFEVANGGTVFLDEIGNIAMPLQAKLLTVLQNREVRRVGSNKVKPIDVRLICATNMPLYEMVKQGRFRQDLLYRVNTIELHLPPLRERGDDIELLARHYLEHYAKKYNKNIHSISPAAHKKMRNYHWPGNVRELQHALERAVIMSSKGVLQPEDLFFALPGSPGNAKPDESVVLEQMQLEEVEKILIKKVLKKYNGNITQAATELGLTRSSLYRRLEKYGL
ncbi:MAG: sigma-54 dependent transcriptional regulator [Bernardetiaceae bacterium]|jgi:DNA-binding NtrC family response regulator|nr:sigma-54 dependent transcriptional regulator [Bernardetiaceae bacterium]